MALLSTSALGLAGCQSTQDKSAELAKAAKAVKSERGVVVRKSTRDVAVGRPVVLKDRDGGTAAVVPVTNRTGRPLAGLPISIDVRGAAGASVFRNDQPGLQASLTHVGLLRPGKRSLWVDDQVNPAGAPRSLRAKVGPSRTRVPRRIPRLQVASVQVHRDPVDGPTADGAVRNRSKVLQRALVVYAVAIKGGRPVAAGRAQVRRLKPGRKAKFHVFLVGDPKGARLQLEAPPTVLE